MMHMYHACVIEVLLLHIFEVSKEATEKKVNNNLNNLMVSLVIIYFI